MFSLVTSSSPFRKLLLLVFLSVPKTLSLPRHLTSCLCLYDALLATVFYFCSFTLSLPSLPSAMYSEDIPQTLTIFQKVKKRKRPF